MKTSKASGRKRGKSSEWILLVRGCYPTDNEVVARRSLDQVEEFGTRAERAYVRAEAYQKYPGLDGLAPASRHAATPDGQVATARLLVRLIANGWMPASQPPDDGRVVQVVWEDGSTDENARCFFDSSSAEADGGPRASDWLTHPLVRRAGAGKVIAWREHS